MAKETNKEAKTITILGSTGSIGKSALEIIRACPNKFKVYGLATHSNFDEIVKQIIEFRPQCVGVYDEEIAKKITLKFPHLKVFSGKNGIIELATKKVDVLLCAIVGASGLHPLLKGIEYNKNIAIANKEPIVMAGGLITSKAKKYFSTLIPVDSEHSAIFQCLIGNKTEYLHRIFITASGGPFYNRPIKELELVTPEEAVNHPKWKMGKKISIDSATLMNKGLEIIEAMWLFDLQESQIEVLIHPQSVVHGLVEFKDGSILAQLGPTDMKIPIMFSFTYPERAPVALKKLDIRTLSNLTFSIPDFKKFPCIKIAKEVAKIGGVAPSILNASNEIAVQAFCERKIKFTQIYEVVEKTLNSFNFSSYQYDLDTILEVDNLARIKSLEIVEKISH
ncbi:MAG: 1-deoxy-D-xylulose-5-phosphate reductoisomerase [Candidatus Hydrogenedentes bacterium]|nr:1-deoxy-D-xylulose-5-phosphate reductoisomerase [Candidatus Hydrogenedentota bacterium]